MNVETKNRSRVIVLVHLLILVAVLFGLQKIAKAAPATSQMMKSGKFFADPKTFPRSAAIRITHPFIYSVEKNGKKSYLFGTWHAGVQLADLPTKVIEFAMQSRVVLGEIELIDDETEKLYLSPEAALGEILKNKYLNLSEQEVSEVVLPDAGQTEKLVRLGYPTHLAVIMNLKTAAGYGTMFPAHSFGRPSLDYQFQQIAKAANIPFHALETDEIRDAAEAYAENEGQPEEVMTLQDALEDSDVVREWTSVMDDYLYRYKTGDAALVSDDEETLSVTYRNKAWMPVLRRELDMGNAFVVAGVGHLVDKNNIIGMLRKAGYKVTRLTPENNFQ